MASGWRIVAVGRSRPGPMRALYEEYARRLTPPLILVEVEERRPLPAAELKLREGRLLLDALPQDGKIVALDQRGQPLSSEQLAAKAAVWPDAAFIIGGADGLSAAIHDRADFVLSLGAMTWPHMLARIMLAEQLYRAQKIAAGHPYHRGRME